MMFRRRSVRGRPPLHRCTTPKQNCADTLAVIGTLVCVQCFIVIRFNIAAPSQDHLVVLFFHFLPHQAITFPTRTCHGTVRKSCANDDLRPCHSIPSRCPIFLTMSQQQLSRLETDTIFHAVPRPSLPQSAVDHSLSIALTCTWTCYEHPKNCPSTLTEHSNTQVMC